MSYDDESFHDRNSSWTSLSVCFCSLLRFHLSDGHFEIKYESITNMTIKNRLEQKKKIVYTK